MKCIYFCFKKQSYAAIKTIMTKKILDNLDKSYMMADIYELVVCIDNSVINFSEHTNQY